jgi:hypothetical protein
VEAINVFNHDNYREYEELAIGGDGQPTDFFGRHKWWTADPGRRLQVGVNFGMAPR